MNIKIINRGDKVRRNFSLREKGWREPTIEKRNPHIGDNIANRKNRIRKSVGKMIFVLVT